MPWFVLLSFGINEYPGVAQIGSALEWGSRGRRFDSCHSDQVRTVLYGLSFLFYMFRVSNFVCILLNPVPSALISPVNMIQYIR